MKFKHSLFLSLALASTAFAQVTTMYPGTAYGISGNGQFVTGNASIPGGEEGAQAFISNKATIFPNGTELNDSGTISGHGREVNNAGNVIGLVSYDGVNSQAAVWTNSGGAYQFTNLNNLVTGSTHSQAEAISNNGWIAGWTQNGTDNGIDLKKIAVWRNTGAGGAYEHIDIHPTTGGAKVSSGNDINSSLTVSGHVIFNSVWNASVWKYDPFLGYSFQNLHTLASPTLGGVAATQTTLRAIADNGSVAGAAFVGGLQGACVWNASGSSYTYMDLSTSITGGTVSQSEAYGIQSDGSKVVGLSTINGAYRASLWDAATGAFTDLNTLVASQLASAGFSSLEIALDMSDNGAIVGRGRGLDGTTSYGFLIDEAGVLHQVPQVSAIPEPTSSVLLGLAGMSFLVRRKRK